MSDDEDELDSDGKRTGRFVSRSPLYRTQEVSSTTCKWKTS